MAEEGAFDFHRWFRNDPEPWTPTRAPQLCSQPTIYFFANFSFCVFGTVEKTRCCWWQVSRFAAGNLYVDNSTSRVSDLRAKSTDVLICLSHLRWDFVFQRPQHLMTRFAQVMSVFFIEEPVLDDAASAWLELRVIANNLIVGVPHLPHAADPDTAAALQRGLLRHVRQTRNNRSGTLVLHTYGDHLRR